MTLFNRHNIEGDNIRRLNQKKKYWLNKRNVKLQRRMQKQKKFRRYKGLIEYINNFKKRKIKYYDQNSNEVFFKVPQNFSLENNPEETISFFNELVLYEQKKITNTRFYIDSSNVEHITVDAIMYLLATINNAKLNSQYGYIFAGNFPKSDEAEEIYRKSGFMSFVRCVGDVDIIPKSEKIQIRRGFDNDPDVAKSVCKYVQEKCGLSIIDTRPLYNILIEMMGNTKQHAYENDMNDRVKCWYLFAEEINDSVKFVFLDTGLGIPTTIKKYFRDKLFFTKDGLYIKSTLDGDYRTRTNKNNRGKGLPQISDCLKKGLLSDVFICSGKGSCYLNDKNLEYKTKEYKNKIFGTLFSWKIKKGIKI